MPFVVVPPDQWTLAHWPAVGRSAEVVAELSLHSSQVALEPALVVPFALPFETAD